MVATTKPYTGGRKLGIRDVTFTIEADKAVRIGGVRSVQTREDADGTAHCLILTLDIDVARSFEVGIQGRLTARFVDIDGNVDPEPTDFGWFRVHRKPLYSCGGNTSRFHKIAMATIRLAEVPR